MGYKILLSEHVKARAESIFRCFEDPTLMKQWIEGLEEFSYLDPQVNPKVGQKFRQVNRMGGRRVVYEGEIIAWEKPHRFAAQIHSSTYSYKMDFRIKDLGTESVINYEGRLSISHPIWRIFGGVITYFSRSVFARELTRLKSVAEK